MIPTLRRLGFTLYEPRSFRRQKERDPAEDGSPPQSRRTTYPLVTTGGGALPLPTYVPQPATLRRASVAAIARVSFFKGSPPQS